MKYLAGNGHKFESEKACIAYERSSVYLDWLVGKYGSYFDVTRNDAVICRIYVLSTTASINFADAVAAHILGRRTDFDENGGVIPRYNVHSMLSVEPANKQWLIDTLENGFPRGWVNMRDVNGVRTYIHNSLPRALFASYTNKELLQSRIWQTHEVETLDEKDNESISCRGKR